MTRRFILTMVLAAVGCGGDVAEPPEPARRYLVTFDRVSGTCATPETQTVTPDQGAVLIDGRSVPGKFYQCTITADLLDCSWAPAANAGCAGKFVALGVSAE